jgi:hypothetical protein
VVNWQLSRFDPPLSHDENVSAFTAFVEMALERRTAVVFVTAPPRRPDGFAVGWLPDLTPVAAEVAQRYPG